MKIILLSKKGRKTRKTIKRELNTDKIKFLPHLSDSYCFTVNDNVMGRLNIAVKKHSRKGAALLLYSECGIHTSALVTLNKKEKEKIIKRLTANT